MKKIYNILFLLLSLMAFASCTSEVDDVLTSHQLSVSTTQLQNTKTSSPRLPMAG